MYNYKNKHNDCERLFQQLLRIPQEKEGKICEEFSSDIISNWYTARNYILDKFQTDRNLGADGISKSSGEHVHVVIKGDSPLLLSVVRQIALVAHFPNFLEDSGSNRTVITIFYNRLSERNRSESLLDRLKDQAYLCNLPKLCKCTMWNVEDSGKIFVMNEGSFIDIELELIGFSNSDFSTFNMECVNQYVKNPLGIFVVEESDVLLYKNKSQEINVVSARRVNMVYNVGADIDNLSADDPNSAERYYTALLHFCYQISANETHKKWNELVISDVETQKYTLKYQIELRNKLSNVFCADCFENRLKSLIDKEARKILKLKENDKITSALLSDILRKKEYKVQQLVMHNIQILARCEHARWNVEKLILGFQPFTDDDHFIEYALFGIDRIAFRKKCKQHGFHVDLCSYKDLRRTNPSDMKYDCFLMMALPNILKRKYSEKNRDTR